MQTLEFKGEYAVYNAANNHLLFESLSRSIFQAQYVLMKSEDNFNWNYWADLGYTVIKVNASFTIIE